VCASQQYGPEFWIRGLGVQDSNLDQDPLLRKYAFLSITRVYVIRIEHVRVSSKGFSIINVFILDSWSSATVAYSSIRPKSQIFIIAHDYTLWTTNFMVMMKNPRKPDFETWSNGSWL
jgi:hypothetical protein